MNTDELSTEELLALEHNDHRKAFLSYVCGRHHSVDKREFMFSWVCPTADDFVLECGSSSGKTAIDFVRRSRCRVLGIDFDPLAVSVSSEMRDRYFPELKERCSFRVGDLAKMTFDGAITKVIMADFTEHIPDRVFGEILGNIRDRLPHVRLYIYTPSRDHLFERLKHNRIILRNPSGHINVKTERQLKAFLRENGWVVRETRWRPSHLPAFRIAETLLGRSPLIGPLFRRRIAMLAVPQDERERA